jgi:hypothetical protein
LEHALEAATPVHVTKEPFGESVEELLAENSRDDKTAIELFLSGVRAMALQSSIIDVVRFASRISAAMG